MKKVNVKHIRHLNSESLRALDFYNQELSFLQERLEEIASDNTAKEVQEKVEYFQNQLLIHQSAIDELKNLITTNNRRLELELLKTDPFVDEPLAKEHKNLYSDYKTEEKLFNDLRHEFNRFAAEWM
ncbi:MAG: hypothetical protein ACTHNW_17150 [Mucilaginibacter sp.]